LILGVDAEKRVHRAESGWACGGGWEGGILYGSNRLFPKGAESFLKLLNAN